MNAPVSTKSPPIYLGGLFAARSFTVAWYWLLLAVAIAICLRWLQLDTDSGWNINYLRHAHSHVAFLGWVFNAFFAVAIQLFVPRQNRKSFFYLFIILQTAVAGMAASFPLQGYGAVSITFSTLHMAGSGLFAWWLWSSPSVGPTTRPWLRMALAFMVLSGLGPLVLGPLAAMDLREHPAYTLAIYFYLHCQYNGWFIFFLLAAVWQLWETAGGSLPVSSRRSAYLGLGGGALGSFALSALWLHPPWPVWLLAAFSAAAQLWGAWQLRPLFHWGWNRLGRLLRLGMTLASACFVAKLMLQAMACLPFLAPLAHHRFIAVAFLHLVFLGIVTPGLACWAWQAGWIRKGAVTRTGLLVFLTGSLLMELILVLSTMSGLQGKAFPFLFESLLATAGVILAGLLLIRPTVP